MEIEKFRRLDLESKQEEYTAKKKELALVSEVAPRGAQKEVCALVGISEQYCMDIRKREGAKHPTTDNYSLVSRMVKEYRKIIEVEKEKLEV